MSKRWTDKEDTLLANTIKKYPYNKSEAFRLVAKKLDRTECAVLFRWYYVLNNPKSNHYIGTCFTLLGYDSRFNNRTNYHKKCNPNIKPEKIPTTLWTKVKKLLKIK